MEEYALEPRKLVVTALRCWALFESLTAELYEQIASKVQNNKVVSLILNWIAAESESHYKYLDMLTKVLGGGEVVEDCARFVGLPWRIVEDLLGDIKNLESLDSELVLNTLRKLQVVEKFVAEETYGSIISNLIKDVASLLRVEGDSLKTVFEEIAVEEEFHENLLIELVRTLEKASRGTPSAYQLKVEERE